MELSLENSAFACGIVYIRCPWFAAENEVTNEVVVFGCLKFEYRMQCRETSLVANCHSSKAIAYYRNNFIRRNA